jgi:hypothetical protein
MVHVLPTHGHFQSEVQVDRNNTTNNNMRDVFQQYRESPYDLIYKKHKMLGQTCTLPVISIN